ncbi:MULTISPECIES: tetratricopeptide repeat protein [Pseudidiomarina]|nr:MULTISPECIES: multiheme c-type cytochrome [Pseudidiomarina]
MLVRQGLSYMIGLALLLGLSATGSATVSATASASVSATKASPAWVDESNCKNCHQQADQQWRNSHHAKALTPANHDHKLPLGELKATEKPVWLIGYEPLQQVLIASPDGRLQAHHLAFATEQQTWFDLYPEVADNPDHPLHWRQSAHLANTQCLSCHVSNYQTQYQPKTDTFASSWQQLGVGCQSCHGPAGNHQADGGGFELSLAASDQQLQVCAQCHSRRNELLPFQPNVGVHQQFLISPLRADLYEVDGKILDEVFEYGSFVQSRMHQAGVTCSDCHNPHSGELRAPANAVCSQCHNPAGTPKLIADTPRTIDFNKLQGQAFATPAHHFHPADSAGAQCVNCHMPGRVYMGNDLRHDHSFSSPNPAQALALEHSDACLGCHQDKPAAEMVAAFARWYPDAEPRDGGYAQALYRAREGLPGAAEGLLKQLQAGQQPAIRHAALLAELGHYPSLAAQQQVAAGLTHPDAWVRRTAIEVAPALFNPAWLMPQLSKLLADPELAVRMTAVEQLLAQDYPFKAAAEGAALAEYSELQQHHLGTAQGHYNQSLVAGTLGFEAQVQHDLQAALQRNGHYIPALIGLAQWLEKSDAKAAQQLLVSAQQQQSEAAEIAFALALMLIRQGEMAAGLEQLQQTVALAPDNAHYSYVLAIALYDNGQHEAAMDRLRTALAQAPQQRHLRLALWQYSNDINERERLMKQLRQLNPFDPLINSPARY